MTDPTAAQVFHNADRHRFELPIEDEAVAAAYYRLDDDGRYVLTHTEVPSDHSGRGFGSTLAHGLFELARVNGYRLVLRCPFLQGWYARHREYGDVVDG